MYVGTLYPVSADELARLLREARAIVDQLTTPPKASFIVPYPFVPDCFADAVVQQVRLVGLLPSQQIVAHCDQPIAPAIRYHLPLQSNPGCWSFHRDGWQQLIVGKIYSMDPAVRHGAVNWGSEVRLQVMIDVRED